MKRPRRCTEIELLLLARRCTEIELLLLALRQVRREVAARTDSAYREDPTFKRRPLAELNAEAAALYKVLLSVWLGSYDALR